MDEYLDKLPLTDDEKVKLSELAAEDSAALLSMMRADPAAFKDYLGEKREIEIMEMLYETLNAKERQIINKASSFIGKLGAAIKDRAPKLKLPAYDIEMRDKLFKELQYWQSQNSSSDKVKLKIKQLTDQLNELFGKENS